MSGRLPKALRKVGYDSRITGEVVEILYTGTAFIVSRDGDLLTNRHVAMPWDFDEAAQRVIGMGLQPVQRRFLGFLPGRSEPFDVEKPEARSKSERPWALRRRKRAPPRQAWTL